MALTLESTRADLPPHYRRLQPLAWDGFAFTLPPRWEVTGYDLANASRGALRLHAGARDCGELSWRPIDGTPDAPLIIGDALNRGDGPDRVHGAVSKPIVTTVGEWQLGWLEEAGERVAVLWQAARARLLMWAFPPPHHESGSREIADLLGSFDPNGGERRRWRLFGMGCALPPGFTLDALKVPPGAGRLTLVSDRLERVTARRFAMVERTLAEAGGIKAFYAGIIGNAGYRLLDLTTRVVDGVEQIMVSFEHIGMRNLDKLMGPWNVGQGRMWHARDEDRLYAWEASGPKGRDLNGLVDAWE